MKTTRQRVKIRAALLVGLAAVLALSWGEFTVNVVAPALQRPYWPAPASWVAARVAWEGHPEFVYAKRAIFYRESARLGAGQDYFEANIPTTILPYVPLAHMDIADARNVWLLFSLGCFLVSWAMLVRSLQTPILITIILWALAPQFSPFRFDIDRGQAYTPLLALAISGALLMVGAAHTKRRVGNKAQVLAGIAFGLAAVIKLYYGGTMLLAAMVRRQATLLVSASGIFGVAALATVTWWGWGLWGSAIPFSLTFRERAVVAVDAYQSLNGLLTHLLHYDAELNPTPIVNLPHLVGPVWWTLALTILTVAVWALWLNGRRDSSHTISIVQRLLAPATTIPLALLLAPICDEYHFVMTLFPLTVVGVVLWERFSTWQRIHGTRRIAFWRIPSHWAMLATFGTAVILLGADWPYRAHSMPGWQALLHYPRLYGNLLILGLVITLLMMPKNNENKEEI
jgi:hypothetical protein